MTELLHVQRMGFDGVREVLERHFYKPDVMGARVLYSGVAAHRLSGQPVWVMLVAPPGSLKTELLTALNGSDQAVAS